MLLLRAFCQSKILTEPNFSGRHTLNFIHSIKCTTGAALRRFVNLQIPNPSYNYRKKTICVCCHRSLPAVDSCVNDVGWALPTFDRRIQRGLVGAAHPTIRNFRNVRVKFGSLVTRKTRMGINQQRHLPAIPCIRANTFSPSTWWLYPPSRTAKQPPPLRSAAERTRQPISS